MERDPNQQQPPVLAHGAGARGSRRRGARPWRWRAWWSGRAEKRRPTTTRVWRTEESSKTRSGGDDTDTGSGLNLRWRPVTDHGRGRRPKCSRSPDGARKKSEDFHTPNMNLSVYSKKTNMNFMDKHKYIEVTENILYEFKRIITLFRY